MDWVYFLWMVEPTAEHGRLSCVPWLDLGLTAAIGGVWWLIFLLLLPPLVAMRVESEPAEQRHG
jgi:hypothetical protein